MTDLTNTAPKRIYLDIGDQFALERVASGSLRWDLLDGVTWSEDNATSHGIPYVRADLVPTPAASGAALLTDDAEHTARTSASYQYAERADPAHDKFNAARVAFLKGADWQKSWAALASPQVAPAPSEEVELIVHLRANRDRRIYIAGPMTGLPQYNFPAFHAKAAELRVEGWHVENPAGHGIVKGASRADYLRWDISRILTCGAIHLLPGWPTSEGATLEVQIGRALGMKFLGEVAAPAPVAPPNLSSPLAGDCRTVGGFLSDVMTAAGLVEHGRQCKPLAERISVACSDLRARIFQGSAPVAPQDDARDAARYRWLRSYPDAVRMLVLHFGYGYSRVLGADMNGPAYLDEVLDEVVETGKDAWSRTVSTPAAKPTEEQS